MENEKMSSDNLNELFAALSKAQSKIEHALKDKSNPFFKSKYADLASVWEACREPLTTNGLSIIQTVEGTKEAMYLITILGHSSGQYMKSRLPIVFTKLDPQGIGSAITYCRRYSLSAIVGICPEDDDGEKAMSREEGKKKQPMITQHIPNQEFITKEQQQEIFDLFETRHSYAAKVLGVYQTIEKIPANMFDRVKLGALKVVGE